MSIAVISGGEGGIGVAVTKRLSKDGFKVIVLSHRKPGKAADKTQTILKCDITKINEIQKTVSKIIKTHGKIDVLIHLAVEPIIRKSVLNIELKEFRGQFEVGFFGGFNLFNIIGKIMKEQKSGHIIGVTTTAIEQNTNPGNMSGYVSAKFATRGLLRELCRELSPHGVRVNAVAPNFVPTPLNKDLPDRLVDFVKEKNPMKTITTPEDVAEVIAFLCREESKSINGLNIPISYGETITL